MKEIICKSAKALDTCLRTLYADHIDFQVKVFENEKGKICYSVIPEADENKIAAVDERIKIMLS